MSVLVLRRRQQLDGVMHDVAAQLDAFRHLQHLLDLLTTIEGVFRLSASGRVTQEALQAMERRGLQPEEIDNFGVALRLQASDSAWEGCACPICLADFKEDDEVCFSMHSCLQPNETVMLL